MNFRVINYFGSDLDRFLKKSYDYQNVNREIVKQKEY